MRILGLGVDLADIDRVGRVLEKYPRFAERCFTEHEREYAFRFANPERRLAARFAGKEAVMKSMGTGWRRIRWKDIEITGGGKPTVRMSGNAARRAEMLGVTEVLVTITHTDTDALVMAIAVGEHD
ncbi:MAG: holo-ACP synthase [Acidobacteria bacterium]|nr:holo-ACP synthase [Acidobacteriota bacterium]MCH8971431.1 holo-ACP synthase [Acidobacteriota bacterium]